MVRFSGVSFSTFVSHGLQDKQRAARRFGRANAFFVAPVDDATVRQRIQEVHTEV